MHHPLRLRIALLPVIEAVKQRQQRRILRLLLAQRRRARLGDGLLQQRDPPGLAMGIQTVDPLPGHLQPGSLLGDGLLEQGLEQTGPPIEQRLVGDIAGLPGQPGLAQGGLGHAGVAMMAWPLSESRYWMNRAALAGWVLWRATPR